MEKQIKIETLEELKELLKKHIDMPCGAVVDMMIKRIKQDNSSDLITVKEAAHVLNVCVVTVRRYMKSGALSHIKVGGVNKIKYADIKAIMEGRYEKN